MKNVVCACLVIKVDVVRMAREASVTDYRILSRSIQLTANSMRSYESVLSCSSATSLSIR